MTDGTTPGEAALTGLLPHHAATVRNLTRHLATDPEVLALLLAGSVAHGFATASSDVDVALVVTPEALARRDAQDRLTVTLHPDSGVVTYEGGYVDGKYVTLDGLQQVAERGSDPARYAYVGARVLFSRVAGLPELLDRITRYPTAERDARVTSFTAQLLGWRWYFGQGVAKDDPYLRTAALAKVVLFACRLVLAETSTLYPHHKWLLRVTESVAHRPADLVDRLRGVLAEPTWPAVEALVSDLLAFYGIDERAADAVWPTHFLRDHENAWLTGRPSVDEA